MNLLFRLCRHYATRSSSTVKKVANVSSNAVENTGLSITNDSRLLSFPLIVQDSNYTPILGHDRVAEVGLKRYPSVSTVMRETQTPQQIFLLKRWREKKIAELGSNEELQLYVQRIKSEGERLHNCLRLFLSENISEKELPLPEEMKKLWNSFRPVLDRLSKVLAVETAVQHKPLGYAGIADCIAEIDGQVVLIDWKVSERKRATLAQTYDTPLQIIAYMGAVNAQYAWNEARKRGEASKDEVSDQIFVPPAPIAHGMAVIGYRDGSPAHVHVIDETISYEIWQKWLEKLDQFWTKKMQQSTPTPPPSQQQISHNPQ